jgi:hypothetical protein
MKTKIVIYDKICIKLEHPRISKNEFMKFFNAPTKIGFGRKSFVLQILGFGFSFTVKRDTSVIWMWDVWKREAILIGCEVAND